MAAPQAAHEIRRFNIDFHDGAAAGYDAKWGIDFGETGVAQVTGKLRKALGREPSALGDCLEIGAGTGYFTLNLLRAGWIERAVCSDISPGMLATLRANAARLGVSAETVACDAEALPFADSSFDTVLGHAVLHHIPDLERALSECLRVLRPGGTIVFTGEPSRNGDRIAAIPKRAGALLAPAWRAVLGAAPGGHQHNNCAGAEHHALEHQVDVHAFTPEVLESAANASGFGSIEVRGEELLANWFGWVNRTMEASADPQTVPLAWKRFAFRGYIALQRFDGAVLEGRLPAGIFYNLSLAARRGR